MRDSQKAIGQEPASAGFVDVGQGFSPARAMDAAQIPAHLEPASVCGSSIKTSTTELGYSSRFKTGNKDFSVTKEISFDLLELPGLTLSSELEKGIIL